MTRLNTDIKLIKSCNGNTKKYNEVMNLITDVSKSLCEIINQIPDEDIEYLINYVYTYYQIKVKDLETMQRKLSKTIDNKKLVNWIIDNLFYNQESDDEESDDEEVEEEEEEENNNEENDNEESDDEEEYDFEIEKANPNADPRHAHLKLENVIYYHKTQNDILILNEFIDYCRFDLNGRLSKTDRQSYVCYNDDNGKECKGYSAIPRMLSDMKRNNKQLYDKVKNMSILYNSILEAVMRYEP